MKDRAVYDPIGKFWFLSTGSKLPKKCWRDKTFVCGQDCAAFEIHEPKEGDTAIDVVLHCMPPGITRFPDLDIIWEMFKPDESATSEPKESRKDYPLPKSLK